MGMFSPYEVPGIGTGPDGRRVPPGAQADGFNPIYLCLVYLRFDSGGVDARHAYFAMPSDLENFTTAEFASVTANGQWATSPIRSEVNFENFTFGSQQLILFHIDPAGAPVSFDPDNLVQFAEWSARGPKTPATRRSRNNSFLNPGIRDWSGFRVLTLENWFVDDAGQPISDVELRYAMNIHVLMSSAQPGSGDGPDSLPMIVDPDTGNGAGHEP